MNRGEASFILANIDRRVCDDELNEALDVAIKALEREQKKCTRPRHCDCCGVLLTEDNNKCGYELCDECNERLEQMCGKERGK